MNRSKFIANTTIVIVIVAVLGVLIYGITVYRYGLFQDINRGDRAQAAATELNDLRRSLVSVKEQGLIMLQSSDNERAEASIASSISSERQKITKYIQLSDYNEELRSIAPKLMVSFEAWSSLELEAISGSTQGALQQRNLSAFLNVMEVLGDSEVILEEDVVQADRASRSLLTSTLVLIAVIFILAICWVWSYSTRERRRYQNVKELHQMSNTDALTGLTNRTVLEDRCEMAIAGARRFRSYVGVFYIDIDGLDELNVQKGYQSGDLVLKEAALRLQKHTREMDTVARVGEDEFSVLAANLKHKEDITVVANKLRDVLTKPVELGKEEYTLSVTIGYAVFPDDGEVAEQLVNRANSSMYKAKGKCAESQASVQH